jgi:DNA-binding FadR family transcriptional regulator
MRQEEVIGVDGSIAISPGLAMMPPDVALDPRYSFGGTLCTVGEMTSRAKKPQPRVPSRPQATNNRPFDVAAPPAASTGVLRSPALVEQVVRHLRRQILTGEFAVGAELPPEGAMVTSLGVSRTVVREAMRVIRAQGLVDVSQGRHPRVRPVDPQFAVDGLALVLDRTDSTLASLVELRRPLESEIAALAAERAGPDHLQQLRQAIEDLRSAADLEARVLADMRFHAVLADATGNLLFVMVLQSVWSLLKRSRLITIPRSPVDLPVRWHERILDAVSRHDGPLARREMLEHIDAAASDLNIDS